MFLHDSGQTSVIEFNDSTVYGQNRHQDHTGIFKVTQESCVLTLSTGGTQLNVHSMLPEAT